jgi:uncharacterized protein YraI
MCGSERSLKGKFLHDEVVASEGFGMSRIFKKPIGGNQMKVLFLIISFCVIGPGCILGQKETNCAAAAFVADPSVSVDVRSGPGSDFKVLRKIPRDPAGTSVIIDGSKGVWIKISRAINSKKIAVFSGTGWVQASLLSVKTRGEGKELHAYYGSAGTETAAVVTGSLGAGLMVTLQGCSGVWVKALIPTPGTEKKIGWLPHTSYCGSLWDDWEDCM